MTVWPLIVELRAELFAYARSVADSRHDAEELVADAIERAARARSRPAGVRAFRLWMFRIIRNLSIDELRKRRVRREYSEAAARLSDDLRRSALGEEERALVRLAFGRLSRNEREILFLIDVMGLTYREAAEVMDVPQGTVMSRISRARKALLDRMAPDARGRARGGDGAA